VLEEAAYFEEEHENEQEDADGAANPCRDLAELGTSLVTVR
jgi:hypothetical protein